MKQTILLAGLIAATLFASCSSNPSEPARLTGNIRGLVGLHSECGIATDHSGVAVKIEGTSFSAVTDAAGRWEVKGIEAGIYNIDYSKPGYHPYKRESFQFVGGGTAYVSGYKQGNEANLMGYPTWTISGLQADKLVIHGNDSLERREFINISGAATASPCGPNIPRGAWIFMSDKSTVSSSDHTYKTSTGWPTEGSTLFSLPAEELPSMGFPRGSTVYVIAYPAGPVLQFTDPDTGKTTFMGLGSTPSNVVSFVVP